jgi:hypothetical protein
VKDGESVDYRYDLGEDVSVIIKAPQLRIHIKKYFVLPFHSVSSAYLPPPRGTLTGMFNAWVWSLANVTAKASCSRSPVLREE